MNRFEPRRASTGLLQFLAAMTPLAGCAVVAATLTALAAQEDREAPIRTHPVLGDYRLTEGFEIELVAKEPLVFDPIDLELDPSGDAWVLEMIGYPIVEENEPGPGRIVRLSDSDGDGLFDRRFVFARGLRYADSILPYFGGLLVVDPPDLLFLKDTSGDGRADLRQTLISGFAVGPSESNFNGLAYGPDNWVYGANGSSGGSVFFADRPQEKVSMRGQDLRFRFSPIDSESPHGGLLGNGEMELAGRMGGGFGVTFDNWGRRYVTHEQRHIQAAMIPKRYLDRDHTWRPEVVEISDHGQGDQARIFPISTTAHRPNHPEQAGYFTAGCGLTHYGGGALGPEVDGSFFVGEAVHNIVHRDVLDHSTTPPVARRAAPEQRSEFLAVRDPSFRAVNFATGLDGALYLVDMQRDVIEHPEWIPDEMEAELDLSGGTDRGRIYRITRNGEPLSEPALDVSSEAALVEALAHPNQARRFMAQRLLVERAATHRSAHERLDQLLRSELSTQEPLARFHRLSTLSGMGTLEGDHVLAALNDGDPRLAEVALPLAEPFLGEGGSRELASRVLDLTRTSDPRLAFQAVLTSGHLPPSEARQAALGNVAALLEREQNQDFLETALLLAVASSPAASIEPFARQLEARKIPPELFGGVAKLVIEDGELSQILRLVDTTLRLPADLRGPALEALTTVGPDRRTDGETAKELERDLRRLGKSPEETLVHIQIAHKYGLMTDARLFRRAERAAKIVRNRELPSDERIRYLPLLELLDETLRIEILLDLLSTLDPVELELAAVDQLSQIQSDAIAPALIERWRSFSPAVRSRVGDLLLYQRSNHEVLLDALENGPILIGEMNLHLERRRTLLRWSTPEVGERAMKLFSDAGVDTRRQAYEDTLPALELEGDATQGRVVFEELCSRCHRVAGIGTVVGPDLSDVFRKSSASLLHDIVDPNAHVSNEYLAYDVETIEGELLSGLLVNENDREIVLRSAEGVERTLGRLEIETLESSGLSLMPEELEIGLELGEVASLLAFLQTPR